MVKVYLDPQEITLLEQAALNLRIIEPSAFQENYAKGQPRIFFRLTDKGKAAPDHLWANPHKALYGK